MKSSNKKIKKSPSEINFENELRKAKMQLEKGAQIQSSGKIPPELESMFLDHIEKFDKAYKNAKPITVFEKIGSPKFKAVDKIPEKGIKKELNSLMNKLMRKGLIVESICKVENREMYRFITEELFKHEIDNISIKGMMTHFTYEEFHPNHEYDIKSHTEDFIREILSDKEKVENFLLGKKFKTSSGKIIPVEKALEKINFFRSFYSRFELNNLKILGLKINDKKTLSEIIFNINFSAKIDGSVEKQLFSGTGKAVLQNKWNYWTIYQIEIPGLKV